MSLFVVVLCFGLLSCKKEPTLEQCISYADELLEKTSQDTEFYKFTGDFNDMVDVYGVFMSVDEDYIRALINDMEMKDEYRGAMTTLTLNNHDSNYEVIESIIADLKSGELEKIFEGKDVLFNYGYVNRKGEVTWY